MGPKIASQPKPKKSRSFSNIDISGSSISRSGEHLLIQTLVRDKGALLYIGGMNIPGESNKKIGNGENHILQQPLVSPAEVRLEDQLLSEQLLANDSLGG
jgi:hypothetical protein